MGEYVAAAHILNCRRLCGRKRDQRNGEKCRRDAFGAQVSDAASMLSETGVKHGEIAVTRAFAGVKLSVVGR